MLPIIPLAYFPMRVAEAHKGMVSSHSLGIIGEHEIHNAPHLRSLVTTGSNFTNEYRIVPPFMIRMTKQRGHASSRPFAWPHAKFFPPLRRPVGSSDR